eukprot:TRINITY_DN2777_c3_g1_i1.p1 TRINITY_DN2777_c3_g1~~TRINITY_DN2777_c3_g1_i1.p1  ORF type:complete len:504 (+),score=66.04 TRINITY_DN2777_c3_g1_i1:256-1767(+)
MNALVGREGAPYVDLYRHFHPDTRDVFSVWNQKTEARIHNEGQRIDFTICNQAFLDQVISANVVKISPKKWSDHAAVTLILKEQPPLPPHPSPSLSSVHMARFKEDPRQRKLSSLFAPRKLPIALAATNPPLTGGAIPRSASGSGSFQTNQISPHDVQPIEADGQTVVPAALTTENPFTTQSNAEGKGNGKDAPCRADATKTPFPVYGPRPKGPTILKVPLQNSSNVPASNRTEAGSSHGPLAVDVEIWHDGTANRPSSLPGTLDDLERPYCPNASGMGEGEANAMSRESHRDDVAPHEEFAVALDRPGLAKRRSSQNHCTEIAAIGCDHQAVDECSAAATTSKTEPKIERDSQSECSRILQKPRECGEEPGGSAEAALVEMVAGAGAGAGVAATAEAGIQEGRQGGGEREGRTRMDRSLHATRNSSNPDDGRSIAPANDFPSLSRKRPLQVQPKNRIHEGRPRASKPKKVNGGKEGRRQLQQQQQTLLGSYFTKEERSGFDK